jgi:hypothetical protein
MEKLRAACERCGRGPDEIEVTLWRSAIRLL